MRFTLCLMAVITLLATSGCIFAGGRGGRGGGESGGHSEQGDHGENHDGDHNDRR